MKYPFISILPLIDEVRDELKVITKSSQFSDEDMYGWAVDASRLIGNTSYESDKVLITINKYIGHLPKEFYLLNNIYACEAATLAYTAKPLPNMQEPFKWMRSHIMRPADSTTLRFCTRNCIGQAGRGQRDLSYTIKVPPSIIRTTFHTGKVEVDYEKLKTGDDGTILMQDEPNALKAVKAYIKVMLLQEKYILQEVPRYIYMDLLNEWESYLGSARISLKFPSLADTDFKSLQQDARYRAFRYKDQ